MVSATVTGRNPLWVAQMPQGENGTTQIRRLLIANRGEIACRIIATCRKLHIDSIAVYVEEDATSRHISDADEAINLGSVNQPDGNPFLNIGLLTETAVRAGAHAVHPGYGYLSENAQFAEVIRAAGIVYVGPPSEAMSTLGDKRQAKDYLSKHEPSIPLIPGFTGSTHGIEESDLKEQSAKIGFPVMIKASAGGGGRGMRIVHNESALAVEFERAQSEAQRSFGLSDCILEKYIEAGKHIEVQIMGDSHGKVISLWERECSVQRRHQKIIEESPCSWLSQEQREKMCATAVKIGELLKYEGAGTVEFIVDVSSGRFYFLEVNARLQVEHPITEETTGFDVVSLQLFVASGGKLSSLSVLDRIPQTGHAIECRLCAEDPNHEFAPQHGLIGLWAPWEQQDVRFESAIASGARVSIYFDSMIAKVVVWAPNRTMAIEKMSKVLARTACVGVTTNQLFLQACLLHSKFRDISYATSFIPSNMPDLLKNPYITAASSTQDLLTLIPAMFLRNAFGDSGTAKRRLFGSVRRGFRNQSFDRINTPSEIITTYNSVQGAEVNPQVVLWGRSAKNDLVQIAPLSLPEESSGKEGPEANASTIVTKMYNALSTCQRAGDLPGSVVLNYRLHDIQSREMNQSTTTSWHVGKIDVSIDGRRLLGYVCTGETRSKPGEKDMADAVRVLCHFPMLGTHVDFRCYSLLSFFESKRLDEAGSNANMDIVKAHMPCKVLKVLREKEDHVKSGEVLMVVESMKMEITISAGKDGILASIVREGEVMDEGAQLCKID